MDNKTKDRRLVKVWNVPLKDGRVVKVATIEQGERKPSMCEGCSAPCCKSFLRPVLTSEEFHSKKFPTSFVHPESWFRKQVPRADYLACLAFTDKSCPYFDSTFSKCTIFPNCPKACLAYDCREDTRGNVQAFVKEREKERFGGS